MRKAALSERELSRKTGISKSVINRLIKEKNPNPTLDSLSIIANFFSIPVGQLIGEIPLREDDLGKYRATATDNSVPALNWHEAYNPEEFFSKKREAKRVLTEHVTSKHAFALNINTASMEPQFQKGSIIIVDPEVEPGNGDFVIVALKGQKFVNLKEIVFDDDIRFFVTPGQAEISQQLGEKDRIIGVVVQTIVNLVD